MKTKSKKGTAKETLAEKIEGTISSEQEILNEPPAQVERKWTIPKNVGDKLEIVTDRTITYYDKRDLSGKGTKMGIGSEIVIQKLDLTINNVPLVRIKKGNCKRTFYSLLTDLNGMLDEQDINEVPND